MYALFKIKLKRYIQDLDRDADGSTKNQEKRSSQRKGPAHSTRQIIKESIYQIEHPILVVGTKKEGLFHPVEVPTDRPSLSRNF